MKKWGKERKERKERGKRAPKTSGCSITHPRTEKRAASNPRERKKGQHPTPENAKKGSIQPLETQKRAASNPQKRTSKRWQLAKSDPTTREKWPPTHLEVDVEIRALVQNPPLYFGETRQNAATRRFLRSTHLEVENDGANHRHAAPRAEIFFLRWP